MSKKICQKFYQKNCQICQNFLSIGNKVTQFANEQNSSKTSSKGISTYKSEWSIVGKVDEWSNK